MHDSVIAIIGGLLVGATLALTGGGGSMVAVPVLTVGMRLSMSAAAPVSLTIVGLSAIAGWWEAARNRELDWKALARFLLAALPMLLIARKVAPLIPDSYLSGGFGLLALSIALFPPQTKPTGEPLSAPRFMLLAALTGAMAGLFGAGGGFLITPALAYGAGLGLCTAIPNALVVITAFGMAGLLSTLFASSAPKDIAALDGPLLVMISVAVFMGWLGARLRNQVAPERIKLAFRLVVGTGGLVMLARALGVGR
jgi:uncharacterized protein